MFAAKHPHRVVALVVAAVLVAACASQDALTSASSRARPDLLGLDGLLSSIKVDTQVAVLLIDPAISANYSLGNGNKLYVRAGGICDLDSNYGPDTWDLPCLGSVVPVLVVARTWYDAEQHPHVEFSPELRFVPSDDDSRGSAELWLKDKSASGDAGSVIRYCNAERCVDEAASDKSLFTRHDKDQGFVYRRIKHFSGYQVSTGRDDEPVDSTGTGGGGQ